MFFKSKLEFSGTYTVHHFMGRSKACFTFPVVKKLVGSGLLGMTFIDWFTKAIHPAERKVLPHYSLSVPILMAEDPLSKAENNLESNRLISA